MYDDFLEKELLTVDEVADILYLGKNTLCIHYYLNQIGLKIQYVFIETRMKILENQLQTMKKLQLIEWQNKVIL